MTPINTTSRRYIGVDGCKAGWIVAVIEDGKLNIELKGNMDQIISACPSYDAFLLDMPIGLPESREDMRPDSAARKVLRKRACTIFNVPSRQALIPESKEEIQIANYEALGVKIGEQSFGIFPKIKQVDTFFHEHPEYKNHIHESHPDICFSMLKGALVFTKKKDKAGQEERIGILKNYLSTENMMILNAKLTSFRKSECNLDDILDAVCLAVSAVYVADGAYMEIRDLSSNSVPVDSHGLKMHIVAPRKVVAKTERAFLSTWTEMDLVLAKLLWSDPQVTKYISAKGKFTQKQIASRLKAEMSHYDNYGISYFPAFTKEGTFLGCCGLRPHEKYGYEFGIHLRPQFWGCGYAKELGEAMKVYAKNVLAAENLFAGHNPNNHRSRKFLPKLGFTYIGEEYYAPTGLMHPSYLVKV